jgi:hypothetical protein
MKLNTVNAPIFAFPASFEGEGRLVCSQQCCSARAVC